MGDSGSGLVYIVDWKRKRPVAAFRAKSLFKLSPRNLWLATLEHKSTRLRESHWWWKFPKPLRAFFYHAGVKIMSGGARLRRLPDGKPIADLMLKGEGYAISLDISPDERYLAVGYQSGKVVIWKRQR